MHRLWTISNIISLSRVVLVIPAVYFLMVDLPGYRWWSALFILLASSTDFFDGYLARRLHQVSDFGKIVDPVADKIGIGLVALALLVKGEIPLWYLVLVVLRDALILIGGIYIRRNKRIIPQANMAGKITVNVIALALFLSLMKIDVLETFRLVVLWLSVMFMIVSLAIYAKRLFIGRSVAEKNSSWES